MNVQFIEIAKTNVQVGTLEALWVCFGCLVILVCIWYSLHWY